MLFCEKEDCKFRSKTKCKNFTLGGEPAYKCKAKHTLISFYADGCSDTFIPADNTCSCLTYRKKGE